jgi:anti-sigma factor RsiW
VSVQQPTPGLTVACQQVVELVTDYLEGALDEDVATALEAHLGLCSGCAEYIEQMRATIRALGHVPVETLSEAAQVDLVQAFRSFTGRFHT